jgi:hypothetical protein
MRVLLSRSLAEEVRAGVSVPLAPVAKGVLPTGASR